MTGAADVFDQLLAAMSARGGVTSGQMFGKACLNVGGKAFLARQNELLAFKLAGPTHARALSETGAALWDPSGKGRPMKEWVAVPAGLKANFPAYAEAAFAYVGGRR